MSKFYEMKAMSERSAEIFLFGYIGDSDWDDVSPKSFLKDLKALGDVDEVHLHISSNGGGVFPGNAIYNFIAAHPANVIGFVDGVAASMASVIAMACDDLRMAENSLMMIHNPWGFAAGDAEEMRKYADMLDKAKTTIMSSYERKTGIDSDELSSLLDQETWLTAAEALEMGFIDSIIEPIEMAACVKDLDFSRFANVPKSLIMSAQTDSPKKAKAMTKKEKAPVKSDKADDQIKDINVDEIKAQAARQALDSENERGKGIRAVFSPFDGQYSDLEKECLIDQDVTTAVAQAKLLAKMGESSGPLGGGVRVVGVEDQSEKFTKGFSKAIMARAGIEKDDAQNEFRGMSLVEAAKSCLASTGKSTRGLDKMEVVGMAFTTSSDYTNVLENIAHKSMLKGYEESEETYTRWTSVGTLSDFKATKRVDLNLFDDLLVVPEGAEFKHGTMGDRGESVQLATYGRLFNISRQAIINDDLSVFSRIPRKMGRAATRTVGTLVYNVLSANNVMSDGVALFHADHSNLGSAAVISTASVDESRTLMATQKDPDSKAASLNITPSFLLVPVAKQGTAIVVMESETEIASSQNNSKRPNSVRNIAEVISDARLTGNAWYMVGNPDVYDTIEVSYLDGNQMPFLEQQNQWAIDGVDFKVRLDAAVTPLDFRGMTKNAGA